MDSLHNNIFFQQAFQEFDMYQDMAYRWNLDFRKISKGAFNANIEMLDLGKIQLARTTSKGKIQQYGETPQGFRTFVVPSNLLQNFYWMGHWVSGSNLLVFPRSNEIDCLVSQNFDVLTISVQNELLQEMLSSTRFQFCNKQLLDDELIFELEKEDWYYIRNFLYSIFQKLMDSPRLLYSSAFIQNIYRKIPFLLLNFIRSYNNRPIKGKQRRRDVALDNLVRYLNSLDVYNIDVKSLCDMSGVSMRTLEYAFKERFDVSPKSYIKALQLNKAFHIITNSSQQSTITNIAERVGLKHKGQFSADYKRWFGENPSETVKRLWTFK